MLRPTVGTETPSGGNGLPPSDDREVAVSLIAFHRVLITTGILFSGGFAAWQVQQFTQGGGALQLALGCVFGLAALGLLWYLLHLDRYLGRTSGG